jgi:serine/threonine protein kinase
MDFISSPYARKYIASLPRKPQVDFAVLYPDANPLAIDLLERTLVFDPQRRISVDDALAHPYLASLHDASMEPTYTPAADDPHFKSLDEPDAHIPDEYLREAIYNQMLDMKSERAAARASSTSFAFAPRAQAFL